MRSTFCVLVTIVTTLLLGPFSSLMAQVEILSSSRFTNIYLNNDTPYYSAPSYVVTKWAPSITGDFTSSFYISGYPATTVGQSSTVSNGNLSGSFRVRAGSGFNNEQSLTGYLVKFRVTDVVHFTIQTQQRDPISSGTRFHVALGAPGQEPSLKTLGVGPSVYVAAPYRIETPPPTPVEGFLTAGEYSFFASLYAYYQSSPAGDKGLTTAFDLRFTPVIAPRILTLSPSLQVGDGKPVELTFVADGNYLDIAWFKNGQPIPGANRSTYTIPAFADSDAGSYTVTLSNAAGSVTSDPIIVEAKVRVPPSLQDVSPSRRAFTGEAVVLTFAATGDAYAITWLKDGVIIPGATGASYTIPSFAPTDAGRYTVRLSNAAGAVSSLPIELQADTRLRNIATRALVGSGEDILIVGFTVGGTTPRDLLLRAAGPRLATFGIGQPLAHPVIRLYDERGQLLASNDGWDQGDATTLALRQRSRRV